eukprot:g3086.t1
MQGSGSFSSPPRRIPSRSGSRAADWTTNRIKDLETELRISKAKIMTELRNIKNKLLEQKAVTAQAQREALRAETERKKLESDQASLEMRIRKAEESRKISEAKASEAKYKITELEKQITKLEDEYDEMEDEYRKEIQALKKRLTAAELSMSRNNQNQDEISTQLTTLKQLTEHQKEQISTLEVELGASKAAAESLTAESLAETLVIKAELAVAMEREAQKDELIERLRAEITEVKDRVEKIHKQKEELEVELATIQQENDKKAQSIAEISEALQRSELQLKQRDEIVMQLESRITQIQEDNKSHEDSLKAAQDSVQSLKQDLLTKTQTMEGLESKVDNLAQVLGEGGGGGVVSNEADSMISISEKLDRISAVLISQNDRVAELEKSKEGQSNEVQHLTNKVATVLREKKAKVGELERQKKEEKSLRRSLAEQEKNINDLNKQMEEAQLKAEKENEVKSKLQTELKALRLQLGEKTVEITELQRQTETLNQEKAADNTEKDKIIIQMKTELEAAKNELVSNNVAFQELQNQVESAGKSADDKDNELELLKSTLNQLNIEQEELKSALEQAQQSSDATGELTGLQEQLSALKQELNETLEGKKDAEEVANQSLEEKASIEEQLVRIKELQKTAQVTITSQNEELNKLKTEKKNLEELLNSAQSGAEKSSSSSVSTKLTSVQKTLKEREDEIRDLQAELNEVIKNSEDAKTTGQKLQAKLTKLENESRQKTTTLQELQQQVKTLKQENTDLNRERDQAANASKSKAADKDKKIQRLERELSVLKDKFESNQNQSSSSKEDSALIEQLKTDLEKQKRKYEAQIRAIQTEPKSFKDMRAEVNASQAKFTQARREKEELNNQLQNALGRLAFYEGPEADGAELGEVGMLKESLREAQRKVSEAQKLSAVYRKQLKQSETMKLELERLAAENSHLSSRTKKLDADVLGLMQASGSNLGHHNQKQKIQYHLKLKTELEELRKQYTVLSREKFKLEQAVRYLAARADLMNGYPIYDVSGTGIRHPSAAVAPASTKESVVLSTPTAKKHMKWASRGRGTTKGMSAYKSRENMEREIEETQVETVIESEALKRDTIEERDHSNDDELPPGSSTDVNLAPLAQMDSVENRILSTISSVVHGRKRRVSVME